MKDTEFNRRFEEGMNVWIYEPKNGATVEVEDW